MAVETEVEVARAFDEERPPLGEERFERRQVDDRGIGFDLAEVRIDRRRERQARRERVLQVQADGAARMPTLSAAGCRRSAASSGRPPCRARARAASATRPSTGRRARRTTTHSRWRCAREQRPGGRFRSAGRSAATTAKPNVLDCDRVEAQLRKRDPELRRPALARSRDTFTSHTASQLSSRLLSLYQ